MRYSTSPTPIKSNNANNSSTLFCEQVSIVTTLFEKWNDCERTVVIYAMLKRLRYPSLKFLLYSIDSNLSQHYQQFNNSNIESTSNSSVLVLSTIANEIKNNSRNSNNNKNNNAGIGPVLSSNTSLSSSNLSLNNSSSGCSSINSQNNSYSFNNIYNKNKNNISNSNDYNSSSSSSNVNNDNNYSLPCDLNANNSNYLQNLISAYKLIPSGNLLTQHYQQQHDNDSNLNIFESSNSSDIKIKNANNSYPNAKNYMNMKSNCVNGENMNYTKKEDILIDILELLPLLKPGNNEAKGKYLSIIPLAVEDTLADIVSTEIVQQIFSYLLIHPAITNDDRRSMSLWLRKLEEHIHSTFTKNAEEQVNQQPQHSPFRRKSDNAYLLSSNSEISKSNSTLSSSLSSINNSNLMYEGILNMNPWQTIAPPSTQRQQPSVVISNIVAPTIPNWNIDFNHVTDSLCDDLQRSKLMNDPSMNSSQHQSQNNNILRPMIYNNDTNTSDSETGINLNASNDDHHVSFSKNGTEILDFDYVEACDKCNTEIAGFGSAIVCCDHQQQPQNLLLPGTGNVNPPPMTPSININMQRWSLNSKISAIVAKTRRSNSLTTSALLSDNSSSASSTSSVITVNDRCSNSSENLSQFALKPRSYSLSIEHKRNSLSTSGSDTRLDDLMLMQQKQPNNMNYLKFQSHNIGMSNIGQWLKSLRLHKYIGLFNDMTYERMLEITEDYLQNLGVTKGASHKLAICIEKLKDRLSNLLKLEEDFLNGKTTIQLCIEELTNIVLTPMKPIDLMQSDNIAWKFLQLLNKVLNTVETKDIQSYNDEECVNALLWILEKAISSEPFISHINELREHKFKLSKIKMHFSPKLHHIKNGNNSSLNKPRWNKSRNKNSDNILLTKGGSTDRINNRKNSHDLINFKSFQSQDQNINNSNTNNNSSTVIANGGVNLQNTNNIDIEKFHQNVQLHQSNNNNNNNSNNMSNNTNNDSKNNNNNKNNINGNLINKHVSSYGNNNNNNISSITVGQQLQQCKSSSYPNFIAQTPNLPQSPHQYYQFHQPHQKLQPQQYHRQHRNSLNNLICVYTTQPQHLFKQNKNFNDVSNCCINNVCNANSNCHSYQNKMRRLSLSMIPTINPQPDHNKFTEEKTLAEIVSVSNLNSCKDNSITNTYNTNNIKISNGNDTNSNSINNNNNNNIENNANNININKTESNNNNKFSGNKNYKNNCTIDNDIKMNDNDGNNTDKDDGSNDNNEGKNEKFSKINDNVDSNSNEGYVKDGNDNSNHDKKKENSNININVHNINNNNNYNNNNNTNKSDSKRKTYNDDFNTNNAYDSNGIKINVDNFSYNRRLTSLDITNSNDINVEQIKQLEFLCKQMTDKAID